MIFGLLSNRDTKQTKMFFNNAAVTILYASIPPAILYLLYLVNVITFASLKIGILISFTLFVILPLIFKYTYRLQQHVIFLNYVSWPQNPDFSKPENYGMEGALNFYLHTDDNVRLGVWHILPEDMLKSPVTYTREFFDEAFLNGGNVIVYNHGNAGNRVAPHRLELYKILRKHFHVIAYDYRSYGDSTYVAPTESGLVKDCIFVYKWAMNRTSSNIFVWGHSLGTGLSTHMLSALKTEGLQPSGLILESPFTSMKEEVSEHPLGSIFYPLPWFHYTVVEPMQSNGLVFASDHHILNVDCPILILHAEDDKVVPYKLGYRLYQTAKQYRKPKQGSVKFVGFPKSFGYGHKHICRDPELISIILEFENAALKETREKGLKPTN